MVNPRVGGRRRASPAVPAAAYPQPMPDDWIRQLGDPVLRLSAKPVRKLDEVLAAQLRRMARTLEEADGAGLAATQVGILRRAFVYRLTPAHPVQALIEPRILSFVSPTSSLSLPQQRATSSETAPARLEFL